jgi:hypothetical protein
MVSCQLQLFLVRAGLLIGWLQLDVSGLRLVLACGWHGNTSYGWTVGLVAICRVGA